MPKRSYSMPHPNWANFKRDSFDRIVLSMCDITVRDKSAPECCRMSTISKGAASALPGWIIRGAPIINIFIWSHVVWCKHNGWWVKTQTTKTTISTLEALKIILNSR